MSQRRGPLDRHGGALDATSVHQTRHPARPGVGSTGDELAAACGGLRPPSRGWPGARPGTGIAALHRSSGLMP